VWLQVKSEQVRTGFRMSPASAEMLARAQVVRGCHANFQAVHASAQQLSKI
jgi:hypothetical protein